MCVNIQLKTYKGKQTKINIIPAIPNSKKKHFHQMILLINNYIHLQLLIENHHKYRNIHYPVENILAT